MSQPDLLGNLRIELRSGCLTLAALELLHLEQYGYELRQALIEAGLEIEGNTLYPLLRRLESQGLLASTWRQDGRRRKRHYKLSAKGERLLDQLRVEWKTIETAMMRIARSMA